MLAVLLLCSCGQAANNTAESTTSGSISSDVLSEETETAAETAQQEDTLRTFSAADEKYVRLLGRTAENDGVLWLGQTDSGCEFSFTGTSASVTVLGDDTANANGEGSYARFAVYLNGERVLDELVKEKEKTYEIFSSDEEKENTVSIIKLSEASNSIFGIKDITVDPDKDPVPTEEKALKIEFIGDSITCGYGVDDEVKEHHFSTATEDGTKTYAYKAAQALDADYSMVCNSGHGIISGYTTQGKKVAAQQMPKFYTKTARSYTKAGDFSINDVMWDFERFVPDIIVINLGTNDSSYTGANTEYQDEFRDAYIEFLKKLRKYNPDSYILCTLGIMGNDLYPSIEEAVGMYTDETGDERVSAFLFGTQDGSTGFAADWHPTEATHQIAADKLVQEIERLGLKK